MKRLSRTWLRVWHPCCETTWDLPLIYHIHWLTVVYSIKKTIDIYRRHKLQNLIQSYQLTPWISVIHEKPVVTLWVKKLRALYGPLQFIAVLTRPHQFRRYPCQIENQPLPTVHDCFTGCVRIPGGCFLHQPEPRHVRGAPILRSRHFCSYSRTSQHFMEPGGSQEPSTGPYLNTWYYINYVFYFTDRTLVLVSTEICRQDTRYLRARALYHNVLKAWT
jgi:hypothetical protein